MSRQFTKTEQHRLAKKFHDALVEAMQKVIHEDPHGDDVLGIDLKWSGPKANVPRPPMVVMFAEDRTTIVRGLKGRRVVAFSTK